MPRGVNSLQLFSPTHIRPVFIAQTILLPLKTFSHCTFVPSPRIQGTDVKIVGAAENGPSDLIDLFVMCASRKADLPRNEIIA